MPQWFDTHVHLDCLATEGDPSSAVAAARSVGVTTLLIPGITPTGWTAMLAFAKTLPGVLVAPGVHPLAAAEWNRATARDLERLLAERPVVAVGEIGLDALLDVPQAIQEQALREQLALAVAAGKPLLLHCRRASERLLRLLDEAGAQRVGGIWHAFSGSFETAQEALRRNFAIAFGGPLTWPGARRAPEVLRRLPEEWIVLETDAPDLAPHPHRGAENRPEWLPLIGAAVAAQRGWTLAQTAAITTANARRVLRLEHCAGEESPL